MTKTTKPKADFTHGPFLKKIILFSIPIILTGLLQSFYNAADLIIVGKFSENSTVSLAAIGTTGALTNVIIGLFMGLSVGAGVCVSQHVGAKERRDVQKVLHTSVVVSAFLGVIIGIIGIIMAPQFLRWMGTTDLVLPHAVLYLRIIFCGLPASMVYNYTASMLRSYGDSKHPLIFLTISGIANVALNVILVTAFSLDVAGVAIATIVSQYLSAGMMIVFLMRQRNCMNLSFKRLKVDFVKLKKILYIGVPSGLQSIVFNFSNVLLQVAVNSFEDETIMAGNAAAGNLEGFIWVATNSIYHVAITFVGQNVGAKSYGNIKRIMAYCVGTVTVVGLLCSSLFLGFGEFFVGLYQDDPSAIARGIERMWVTMPLYFMCGIMDVFCGGLRAMGKSVTSMVISLVGACGFRVLWLVTFFPLINTPASIFWCYPISWFLTAATLMAFFIVTLRNTIKREQEKELQLT